LKLPSSPNGCAGHGKSQASKADRRACPRSLERGAAAARRPSRRTPSGRWPSSARIPAARGWQTSRSGVSGICVEPTSTRSRAEYGRPGQPVELEDLDRKRQRRIRNSSAGRSRRAAPTASSLVFRRWAGANWQGPEARTIIKVQTPRGKTLLHGQAPGYIHTIPPPPSKANENSQSFILSKKDATRNRASVFPAAGILGLLVVAVRRFGGYFRRPGFSSQVAARPSATVSVKRTSERRRKGPTSPSNWTLIFIKRAPTRRAEYQTRSAPPRRPRSSTWWRAFIRQVRLPTDPQIVPPDDPV